MTPSQERMMLIYLQRIAIALEKLERYFNPNDIVTDVEIQHVAYSEEQCGRDK